MASCLIETFLIEADSAIFQSRPSPFSGGRTPGVIGRRGRRFRIAPLRRMVGRVVVALVVGARMHAFIIFLTRDGGSLGRSHLRVNFALEAARGGLGTNELSLSYHIPYAFSQRP